MPALNAARTPSRKHRASDLVSIEDARALLASSGKPLARQTVMALCLRQEVKYVTRASYIHITRASIDAYRSRHALPNHGPVNRP